MDAQDAPFLSRIRTVPWPDFTAEILELYEPPMRARATLVAVRLVLRELGEAGAASTAELTPALIARWIRSQWDRGRNGTTIRGYLGKARALCSYACSAGYLDRTPFGVRREWVRKDHSPAKPHLSLDQVAELLGHLRARASQDWYGHRLFALTALVAFTGVRTSEALHAMGEDVDLSLRIFKVSGRRRLKTVDSAAPVPLAGPLADVLAEWLPRTGSDWLFPGHRRTGPWTGGPPGYKPVERLKAEAERIGLQGVTFLTLRHSWATHGESAWGLQDPEIQRVLRHTTPLTQKGYRHADLENLRRIGERVNYRIGDGREAS